MGEDEDSKNRDEKILCDSATIWRYMDLTKFILLLTHGGLWFNKAADFKDDPFEGFCNVKHADFPSDDDSPKVILKKVGVLTPPRLTKKQWFAALSEIPAEICQNAREHLYVNPWCMGEHESMAMWQIFGSLEFGLAVKSTVGRYKSAGKFQTLNAKQYTFGAVKYHINLKSSAEVQKDFSQRILLDEEIWQEALELGFQKRSCYQHENEWRAVIYQDSRPESGFYIDFDLGQLIEAVYVGPRSKPFFIEAVQSTMCKFSLKKPLIPSDLLHIP